MPLTLLSFFTSHWRTLGFIVLIVVFVSMVEWIKHQDTDIVILKSSNVMLTGELKDSQDSVHKLQEAVDGQNQAINAMAADAEKRAAASKTAHDAANASAAQLQALSHVLLTDQLPKGADQCTAANDLLNEWILQK
jgi:uncharacterized protein YlxW (UPF0749 family)